MTLRRDLEDEVRGIFSSHWAETDGIQVPDPNSVQLGNHAKKLECATVLYADLAGSTKMVDSLSWQKSAEVYKSYLHCAGKIIQSEGGTITAYDGDRVMAVFVGKQQSTSAARCALKINWAVQNIVNPGFKKQYPATAFSVRQVVGIDTGLVRASKIGVRGDNDLVWIGRGPNYAAKLTEIDEGFPTWITQDVYERLHSSLKTTSGRAMWESRTWTKMNNFGVYRSDWGWPID